MTDQAATEDPENEAGADGEDGEAPARGGRVLGKRLVLFIILPFLLIGAAGGGIYASGLLDSILGIEEHDGEIAAAEVLGPSVYYERAEGLQHEFLGRTGKRPVNQIPHKLPLGFFRGDARALDVGSP